jgi:hypothetical protein
MAQRPVHYVHCDGCNKAPVHGVLMQSTTGAKLTNLCADCFCTFSEHIDDANRKVLLADFGEQLAQYQSILHTEIDEINAHECAIHQLKAVIRQRQLSVSKNKQGLKVVEASIHTLKLELEATRKNNEMVAIKKNGAFKQKQSLAVGPASSAIWLELQNIREVCAKFVENTESIYSSDGEMSSFMHSYGLSYDMADLPNQSEAHVYSMIRDMKNFNEILYNGEGMWGCKISRQGIQNRWCNAARCLSNGTFVLTADDDSEHLVNFAVHVCDDWDDDEPRFIDLVPQNGCTEDGIHVLNFSFHDWDSNDIPRVYMRTLSSSAGQLAPMHVIGSNLDVFTPPSVGNFKEIKGLQSNQLPLCELQTGHPLQTVVRLNVLTTECLLRL